MNKTSRSSLPSPVTVYYDGACPVCSREIAVYRNQVAAEQCQWVDASDCADAMLGGDLSRSDALARFHVRRADGTLASGTRAFAALWVTLPRTVWLGRIAGFGPMPALLDVAYAVFLQVRRLWRPARPVPPFTGKAH